MKNTKAIVDASPCGVFEIKKYILLRAMKKIDDIMRKTRRIRKMTAEFYGRIDVDLPHEMTDEQLERHAKKINDFMRGIGRRWGEIWIDKEEIRTTMTILSELSEIRREYMGVAEEEQMSWADIRQEIQHQMKNSFCM